MAQCELEQTEVTSGPSSVEIPIDFENEIEIEIEIEQEALATRPAGAASIAVAVGLDGATVRACASALGDGVIFVAAQEVLEAIDLVGVLRPGVIFVSPHLDDAEGTRLTKAAASLGIPQVCVRPGASVAGIAPLVRRVQRRASGLAWELEQAPPSAPGPHLSEVVLAIGLDAEMVKVCARALGDAVELVAAPEDTDVSELLLSLQPRFVIVTSCLTSAHATRLDAAAASSGAPIVCVGTGVSAAAMTWLVQRAVATELGVAPVLRRRAHRTPRREVLP